MAKTKNKMVEGARQALAFARGDVASALKLVERIGGKEKPRAGDELPAKPPRPRHPRKN